MKAEQLLDEHIRITDTSEYLEPLALSSYILKDRNLFHVFSIISGNQAFSAPVRISWEPSLKQFIWDMPIWT